MTAENASAGDGSQHDEKALQHLDTRIMRGSGWIAAGYGGRQVLSFVSMAVLARLVEPSAFGLIALAGPFLIALQYLQESGLASALIHRRGDVRKAAATVLVFSPLAALGLYAVSFALAPFLADLFHAPRLTAVLRVLAILILIRSLAVVPGALIERDLKFGIRAVVDLCSVVAQFGSAIGLAVAGFGVWSLVVGQIAAGVVSTVLYWVWSPMRPRPWDASLRLLRELGRYGRFVSASNILSLVSSTADNLVIGRLLGTTQLGYYTVSYRLGILPNNVIGYIVGRVMFSVYATLQRDIATVRRVYVQNLQRIAIFALPVSILLIVAARPIVLVLLGSRWAPAITPLRLIALMGLMRSFIAPAAELFNGLGKPHINFVAGIAFAVPVIPALFLLVPVVGLAGGPLAFLIGQTVAGVPVFVVAVRTVQLGARELAGALAIPALPAALMGILLVPAVELTRSAAPVVSLTVVVVIGVAAYVGGAAVFARGVILPMWASLRARAA